MIRRIFQFFTRHQRTEEDIQLGRWMGSYDMSQAGVRVDADSASRSATFYSCLNVLSRDLAALPHILYEIRPDGFRERATNKRLYDVLRYQPNSKMTAIEYWTIKMWHVILRGAAYSQIVHAKNGEVSELIPLHTDYLREEVRNGKSFFVYTDPLTSKEQKFADEDLFKVYAPFKLSVVAAAREAIGLQLAQEQYAAKFFSNYAAPRGVISFKGSVGEDEEALKRWKQNFMNTYAGAQNAWGVAILENGAEFKPISISMQDAEFLDARKYQRTEICGLFPVPPHKIGDLERATFSNIEHQEQAYVNSSLVPWKVIFEESVRRDLLTVPEKNKFEMEVLTQGLLRGDTKSRNEAYAIARNNGWMSANDIRRAENQNPIDNGDTYLVPLNMIPADLLEKYLFAQNAKNTQRDQSDINVLVENHLPQELKSKIIKTWRGADGELLAKITPEVHVNGVDKTE